MTLLLGSHGEVSYFRARADEDHLEGSPLWSLHPSYLAPQLPGTVVTWLMKWKYPAHCQTSATEPGGHQKETRRRKFRLERWFSS